jgi:ABC-type transport system substrate-binding protein
VTMLLAAAGGASGGNEGGTFRVVEPGLLSTIDPALISYPPEYVVLRATCGALVAFPEKPLPEGLQVEPELAEKLPSVSRNGKTYTFTIRRDARFSDGKPVTARDFVHALERILNPVMKSPNTPSFENIVGARAMLDGKATRLAGAVARGRTLS